MFGSRPEPEEVTRSTGMGWVLPGSAAIKAAMRVLTSSSRAGWLAPGWNRRRLRRYRGMAGGREASPEILGIAELLADQCRAGGLAVADDQAAVGLARENKLGQPVTARG